MEETQFKYNLFVFGKLKLASNDRDEIWDAIGWGPYEVLDENGNYVEEFVPF